jgi:hypothetical protein
MTTMQDPPLARVTTGMKSTKDEVRERGRCFPVENKRMLLKASAHFTLLNNRGFPFG